MAVKNSVLAVPLSTLTVAGTYQSFTALPQACFLIRIINGSNAGITVSFDGGVSDNDFVSASGVLEVQAQTNAQPNNFLANFAKGLAIAVKGSGAGSVYLAAYYHPSAG